MAEFVEHILVPTDFGESAWSAFRRACDLGRPLAARLTLLHVKPRAVQPSGLSALRLLHAVLQDPPRRDSVAPTLWSQISKDDPARLHLADIADSDWSLGVEVDTLLTQGDVAAEILRVAADMPATLIIMGARTPSSSRDGVIKQVLQAATGPVMLVPRTQACTAKKWVYEP